MPNIFTRKNQDVTLMPLMQVAVGALVKLALGRNFLVEPTMPVKTPSSRRTLIPRTVVGKVRTMRGWLKVGGKLSNRR